VKVLTFFPNLNRKGGAPSLCVSALQALVEKGHDVTLLTLEKLRWDSAGDERIESLENKIDTMTLERRRTQSLYEALVDTKLVERKVRQLGDEFQVTLNLKANEIPAPLDICYVHYPSGPAIYYNIESAESVVEPRYQNKIFWKMYFQPYRSLLFKFSKALGKANILATNGQFSASLIKRFYGREATLLFPPFPNVSQAEGKKEAVALTISVLKPRKELGSIMEAARHLPSIDFYIIGRVDFSEFYSSNYYYEMLSEVKKIGLTNLHLLPNASDEVKSEVLSKASMYIHPSSYEHFGIAVIEAMRAGAAIVVKKGSGSWIDITGSGEFGFGYESQSELETILTDLVSDRDKLLHYMELSRQRANAFSYESFRDNLESLVERAAIGSHSP
jgi:glycosyltransferase involved in cell wall biosynthesis